MRLAILIGLLFLTATSAWASAWMRETQKGFLSTSATVLASDQEVVIEVSTYLDYGLAPWITVGADWHDRQGLHGHLVTFARLPLNRADHRNHLAAEIGLGGHYNLDGWHPMAKLMLSFGRGFQTRSRQGWIAGDVAVEWRGASGQVLTKMDWVAGWSGPSYLNPVVWIETAARADGWTGWALRPGLSWRRNDKSTWIIAYERRKTDGYSSGLKLSLWRNF